MILCLVTDRRRLGEALGLPQGRWVEALRSQVEAASSAGIDYIQIREPDIEAGPLVELVRSLMTFASSRTRILVNDRLDVALAAQASQQVRQIAEISNGDHLTGCHDLHAPRESSRPGWLAQHVTHQGDLVVGGARIVVGHTNILDADRPTNVQPVDRRLSRRSPLMISDRPDDRRASVGRCRPRAQRRFARRGR